MTRAKPMNSQVLRKVQATLGQYWRRGPLQKIICIFIAAVVLTLGGMYGISTWYTYRHANKPLTIGATFIAPYARQFELDPKETLAAIISELGINNFRLVSYWSTHEPAPGQYDFSDLDWQFDMIEQAGGNISLAIGLRQPRWPECHMPDWVAKLPKEEWAAKLKEYIGVVVERYKDRAVLKSYQLENEFFLKGFGNCPDFSRERLISEYELVKSIDPSRTLIVSRSNNALGWPHGQPQPDRSAVSVYKRLWDKRLTKRYLEYPIPAWYYGFLAGWNELVNHTDTMIHELQAEAWLPPGYNMASAPIDELYKSLNPKRLEQRIAYGVNTGMRNIDLWGVEWWYQMKLKRGQPELWDTARETLAKYR